jgi:phage baseplate assembly protein W
MGTPLGSQLGNSWLGVGWAFPPTPDAPGDVDLSAYEIDVEQAVLIILGTNPGERVMRPDFGAGLSALVFEPMNATTAALVQNKVETALITWEPRIDTITVTVTPIPQLGQLQITVRYRIRATNTFYNLVYPFYLTEGQPS